MDELRSHPFSAGLRRLLTETLEDGERLIWQGQPDGVAHMMMWRFSWWIGGLWLLVTAIAFAQGFIEQSAKPLLMVGIAMVAAPFVLLLQDMQTLFAITDRRALILRTAWGRRTVRGTSFAAMDKAFEILEIGRGAGHLNFASGVSTRSPDTDYTGRYGFRCVRDPADVRGILERARR
ncbi:hypothetical protein C2U70_10690 [Bradyrhizobium guangdongense]|uniref:hypothetical protein n=1 Tax=Bradyrhizobium guangdongense TaxID=1325090 RepID=UPI00112D8D68|nr:hypothetical protein [Bradyrhizobium guangdongense]TPQ37596.1 hypothetical protein C2U70_10690 [Bradyrhizobium guangdongense]